MTGVFEHALGESMGDLSPTVRNHFATHDRRRRYRGVMSVVWRRRGLRGLIALPFLHVAARSETLFPETGEEVPFALENVCARDTSGRWRMTWVRQFYFPAKTRVFTAEMYFDSSRGTIIDLLGRRRNLEVQLNARVEQGVFHMTSGKQRLRTRLGMIRLPKILTGQATVREEEVANGKLKITVTIHNVLLGPFFGYTGVFNQEDPTDP